MKQQTELLNLPENFIGLGKSTNASKGAHSWSDWKGHSKLGPVAEDVRENMLHLETNARQTLQESIDRYLE